MYWLEMKIFAQGPLGDNNIVLYLLPRGLLCLMISHHDLQILTCFDYTVLVGLHGPSQRLMSSLSLC